MPFRTRDLLLPPSLISLVRVPLAVLFPFTIDRPGAALVVLGAAGLSDILDGWVARRFQQETAIGAMADALSDKAFALTVVLALLSRGRLGWLELFLLGTRDLGELGLIAWFLWRTRGKRASEQRADSWGKATTFLQFAALGGAVLSLEHVLWPALAAGACGAMAAGHYARRLARELA